MPQPLTVNPPWLDWVRRLQAIAQSGLAYTEGPYDRERYEDLLRLAAEIAAAHAGVTAESLATLFEGQQGYATPKVDLRAAVFQGDAILMVKERADGCWTLPGGWADVGESPRAAVAREVVEESGYVVRPTRVLAIYDRDHPRHGHPPYLFHAYKIFFLCELIGGEPAHSLETDGVGFFTLADLPPLSTMRVTASEIADLFRLRADPALPADFD